jgi:ATP adenylyltransferase
MKRLWAPWRMKYIKAIDKENKECIFCVKPRESEDKKNLILLRGEKSFIILNAFPYSNGHILVVPYLHTPQIDALDGPTASELWKNTVLCKNVLNKAYRPDGFNIGMNLGRAAGAGIEQHLHVHIVPRWNGDTNFMPIMSETRVVSESLEDTYDALLPFFKELSTIS